MVTAIIQARMCSTRLPCKTLMEVEGKPLLWHLLERIKEASLVDNIVIATTYNPKDKAILEFSKRHGIPVFQGDENDVLDRMYQAAKKAKADTIVRVTPDCPLLCPKVLDKVVAEFLKGGYDYVTNTLLYTYPDGCDVEVFSFKALECAWKECKDAVMREHVTSYFINSGKFKMKNVENKAPVDPRDYKWSVDRIEDLKFVKEVFRHLYGKKKPFFYEDVMNLLKKYPELRNINREAIMNEGYYKSILKSPVVKPKKLKITRSLALKKEAETLIPGCSQTFSKGPTQFVQGVAPVFVEKGSGAHVWDVDGNKYLDYSMAMGPVILGHNYSAVSEAAKRQIDLGTTFTLPHRSEVELARMLRQIIPCAEMVRFGKNGSDATSAAVRIARDYAGREKIACCGYHGWQDWYVAVTPKNSGVPEEVKKLTKTFEYNNIESLEKLFRENKNEIACVIMEPVGVVEPKDNFLAKVKDITHKNKAILIFDEVVTGFRLSLGGAQEYFHVTPDIGCFGKAMGNGFPISTVVGRKDLMKRFEKVFCSFTFGGEAVSIAASIATIKELKDKNAIKHLWEQGRRLRDGYNILVKEHDMDKYTQCIGLYPHTVITFKNNKGEDDLLLKSLFQQECLKRGILFTGSHNITFSHTKGDIDYTLRVYNTVLKIAKEAIAKNKVAKLLEGKPVRPVFRKA